MQITHMMWMRVGAERSSSGGIYIFGGLSCMVHEISARAFMIYDTCTFLFCVCAKNDINSDVIYMFFGYALRCILNRRM